MDFKTYCKKYNIVLEDDYDRATIQPIHIMACAGTFKKIFNRSEVKKDMNDFVDMMINGGAYYKDETLKLCFNNGASKKFTPEKLGFLLSNVQDENLLNSIIKENKKTIADNKDKIMDSAISYSKFGHTTLDNLQTFFDLDMPQEKISNIHFFRENNFMNAVDVFCENKASKQSILDFLNKNPNMIDNSVPALLKYGFEPKEIITVADGNMICFSNDSFDKLWNKDPEQTNIYSMQAIIKPTSEFLIERTLERINKKGAEPIIADNTFYDTDDYVRFGTAFPNSLMTAFEQNEGFFQANKENILKTVIAFSDKDNVDRLINKGAELNADSVGLMGLNERNNYKATPEIESMMEHLLINHNYKPCDVVKERFKDSKHFNQLLNKKDLNEKLENKLQPKEQVSQSFNLSDRPRQGLAKKMKSQGMKI